VAGEQLRARLQGLSQLQPEASTSRDGCAIEVQIAMAACLDGTIPVKHALRGGFLEPGEGGRLVRAEGDASTWRCPEYRGYDEPDDRPHRGPRPPEGQMDIFDPRNAPERVRVLA
jgi:hypothetical protein